jgi:hypothetical protein
MATRAGDRGEGAVRAWKQTHQEVFLPLSHPPGEAQVDFGEATVKLNGVETKVALFVLTLPYSGVIFIQAFPRECTETFLEGHRRAFEHLGGVPRRISYDNSAIAVIEVLKGRERKLTREFLRLQSHYLFREHFCLVRRANEKGHVERLVGFARRNFLVPVPQVQSLAALNQQLRERCQADLAERTRGKPAPKSELLREDQAAFLPLPKQAFEARRVTDRTADSQSLVRFDDNDYSVPVQYAHRKLLVVATAEEVRLVYEDRLVAKYHAAWIESGPSSSRSTTHPSGAGGLTTPVPGEWGLRVLCLPPPAGSGGRAARHRSYIRVLRLLEKSPAATRRSGRVCLGH